MSLYFKKMIEEKDSISEVQKRREQAEIKLKIKKEELTVQVKQADEHDVGSECSSHCHHEPKDDPFADEGPSPDVYEEQFIRLKSKPGSHAGTPKNNRQVEIQIDLMDPDSPAVACPPGQKEFNSFSL